MTSITNSPERQAAFEANCRRIGSTLRRHVIKAAARVRPRRLSWHQRATLMLLQQIDRVNRMARNPGWSG